MNEAFINVTGSKFVNNTAENAGGVLFTPNYRSSHKDNYNILIFKRSIFCNNKAINSGGAFTLLGNDLTTLLESEFTHNNANIGGVIYLLTANNLTINYSNLSYNSAKTDGGVIYSSDQNVLTISNSKLHFNYADNNGGVLIQTELSIEGRNCSFIGNRANSGGVVNASESQVNICSQSALLANNTAGDWRGYLFIYSSSQVSQ